MFNAGAFVIKPFSAAALTSAAAITGEGGQSSEFAENHTYTVTLSAAAALTACGIKIEEFDPQMNAWMDAQQNVQVITGGGTPQAVNQNTAAANMVTGSVCFNHTGVTNLTANGSFKLTSVGKGFKTRLNVICTGGTVVVDATYVGNRNFVG